MDTIDDAGVRTAVAWLEGRDGLRLALLFGSAARGGLHPGSDLDVAVLGDGALGVGARRELVEGLAAASGRAVDLIDLAVAGQPLLGNILSEGRRLFGSDEAYAALVVRNIFERADFLPVQQRIIEERRQAWIGS